MDTVLYLIVLFAAFEIGYFLDKKNRAFVAKLLRERLNDKS